jgi:hypothetical protein
MEGKLMPENMNFPKISSRALLYCSFFKNKPSDIWMEYKDVFFCERYYLGCCWAELLT